MKHRAALAGLLSAIVSAAIWAGSPMITGHREPWDAGGLFYVTSLVAGGFVCGLFIPKPLWAHYLGSVSGQVLYELLFLRIGPLFILGVGFLLGYSLLFLAGAFVGALLRAWQRRPKPST